MTRFSVGEQVVAGGRICTVVSRVHVIGRPDYYVYELEDLANRRLPDLVDGCYIRPLDGMDDAFLLMLAGQTSELMPTVVLNGVCDGIRIRVVDCVLPSEGPDGPPERGFAWQAVTGDDDLQLFPARHGLGGVRELGQSRSPHVVAESLDSPLTAYMLAAKQIRSGERTAVQQ